MGPCGGRQCGAALARLTAEAHGLPPGCLPAATGAPPHPADPSGHAGRRVVMRTADAVVIGGGLHGCATALHLALGGLRPLLLERGTVGRHASGANAGGVRSTNRHVAELPLAAAALDRWRQLSDLLGEDVEFHAGGAPAAGGERSRTRCH